jgi:predicted nucleic acid-binding protein
VDFVLDTPAMLAILRGDPGCEEIATVISGTDQLGADQRCFAHALSLCEVYCELRSEHGEETALNAITELRRVGVIENAEIDPQFWIAAGTLQVNFPQLSIADCFAVTLSGRLGATILTTEDQFSTLVERGLAMVRIVG